MSETFLEMIASKTRERIAMLKRETDFTALKRAALGTRSAARPHSLRTALAQNDRTNIIAEIKRGSPSKGVINADVDVAALALSYESGGAAAVSVLTEPEYFHGSLDDLRAARGAVDLPILRKDFIVDEFQIYESAAAGADAVLLIVAAINPVDLRVFLRLAEDVLKMDALVEVHTKDDLKIAAASGARIIGVNNRDLHSLTVSLDVSRQLIKYGPENTLMVAESGLSTRDEIDELRGLGFNGFLIGETLMMSGDAEATLGGWI